MRFRQYNQILLGVALAFLALVAVLALTLEPIDGDLTRVGGLPERAFGWRGTKPRFVPEPARYHEPGAPIESAEVVVLGDSFSHQSAFGFGWQNFFIARTGLDLLSFNQHDVPAGQVIGSPALGRSPPRLIIYECAELNLPDWPAAFPGDCSLPDERRWRSIPVRATPLKTEPFSRRSSFAWDLGDRMDQAMHVVKVRSAALLGRSRVRLLRLGRDDLFTSRDQRLLLYDYDVPSDGWRGLDRDHIACGLRNIQNQAQRMLGVPLVFMLVPSKLSAYSDQVPGAREGYGGFIQSVVDRSGIPVPNLLRRLKVAVATGSRDLYLPNNSHWSDQGHRIAADALYDHLIERGLIAR